MGYIIEPKGVDLIVGPSVLTADDTRSIRSAIADYRRTGTIQATVSVVVKARDTKTKGKSVSKVKGKVTPNKKLAAQK